MTRSACPVVALVVVLVVLSGHEPGLAQALAQNPSTAAHNAASAQTSTGATRPVTTSPRGALIDPGGGLTLNFREASIDSVLDELSAAAGFIVVKVVKPEGRVTLVSKQPVKADEAIELLNTVLRTPIGGGTGYAASSRSGC